ncbi:MAG: lauroyl/myristoyl acyltransferase [Pseudohongiellaceae bacterium]|jgi:lauroyl/myristoyl acyltransferase
MKEFIFSVLSYLGGRVHNGFVRFRPLFIGGDSSAVHFQRKNLQQKKPQQKKAVSVLAKNSRKYSSSATNHNVCSKNQLNIVKIAFFLREPIHATAKALIKNRAFLDNIERLRNSVQSTAAASTFARRIQIPQYCQIRELLNRDQRSRIVASFHFGNFVYGLHKFVCLQREISNTAVLSQTKSSTEYIENMTRAFGGKGAGLGNQMLLDKVDVLGLSQFLRKSNRCLVMFADLPSEFGQTIEVEFLGRKAAFSKSIALLALTNKVPILPVICFKDGDTHQIEIGRQIEPRIKDGESRADAVTRMTQLQIDFFQYFFNCHSEQWRYLNHLPEYFTGGRTENH